MAAPGNTATNQTKWSYDVFLSFRGEDTRYSFTDCLYRALCGRVHNIFRDDEGLKGGDQIKPSLVNAIQQSRILIVVLSENYASSTWCLDELVEILKCMRLKNQLVWPIFYKVAPSDVRHQRNSYAKAMAEHEKRFGDGSDKVKKWRSALSEVACLKGWHYETGYEYEFIEGFLKENTTELQREQLEQLDVGEDIIGHQSRLEELKSLLDIESHQTVCMLGIHGIGGMGKTTLAKALYNSIIHQFECVIFLESIREKSNNDTGMVDLQKAILSKLFEGGNIELSSVSQGVTRLKAILQKRRVLLVLDDVDKEDQLEKLARNCNWFGSGSRIIITTRNKHVLDLCGVEKRFEMKGLNDDEALELFCLKAFKKIQPLKDYEEVSKRFVQYAGGLPLALKVIGSHLFKKSVKGCEDALKQYNKIPEQNILDILKISYECLDDSAKHIFLDIACFFKGKPLEYVEQVWEQCELYPSNNVEMLVDKSLITIENGCLSMHDLIQAMGREIVRLEAPDAGERSRLYFRKDILDILREDSGSKKIRGIMLEPPTEEEVNWTGTAFEKMTKLQILIIRNTRFTQEPNFLPNSLRLLEWEFYPSNSLPSKFLPKDIVDLSLPRSHLTLEEAKPLRNLVHLTCINFSECQNITHFPDVSGVPNLNKLFLGNCRSLTAIHHSVGFHRKLKRLEAYGCTKLEDFPPRMSMTSLQSLDLRYTSIAFFPDIEERIFAPLSIYLGGSRIKELPASISNLVGLETMSINYPINATVGCLPSELFMLPNLSRLDLKNWGVAVRESLRSFQKSHAMATTGRSTLIKPLYYSLSNLYCPNCGLTDENLHIILSYFPNLENLLVAGNEFVSLPVSIRGSAKLRLLDVRDCLMLEEIPELPKSIEVLLAAGCPCLSSEAFNTLWSQALKEGNELQVEMPRTTKIPDWFDHHCKGGIVSFRARREFPILLVAFILEEQASIENIHIRINGLLQDSDYSYGGGGACIFDLRSMLHSHEKWGIVDTFQQCEWNYVEIECECSRASKVSSCGAYVYKQETNMEDIQFTCPSSLKRTLSIVDDDSPKRKRAEETQA